MDEMFDVTPKADDHPFIISVLNYQPKQTMKEFLMVLPVERRAQLYSNVMSQKNGDRVLKFFISELGLLQQLEEIK